jgi:hypothetical protein
VRMAAAPRSVSGSGAYRTAWGVARVIDHKNVPKGPQVRDRELGSSHSFPTALRILVGEEGGGPPAEIGRIAYRDLDRLLHHANVLKCGPRSWRTKVQADLRQEEAVR